MDNTTVFDQRPTHNMPPDYVLNTRIEEKWHWDGYLSAIEHKLDAGTCARRREEWERADAAAHAAYERWMDELAKASLLATKHGADGAYRPKTDDDPIEPDIDETVLVW